MSDDQAKLVEQILNAKTLYDVLGVSPENLEKSALRKAYLKTSVAVHPDKNQHPQATQAFQRVAEAWGTLSDESARAEYDAELRGNTFSGGAAYGNTYSNRNDNTHYAYDFERTHMPSFHEALFMFATVTSMFSGGGGASSASRGGSALNAASDFVETLFWAQQLAEGRNNSNRNTTNSDSNDRSGPNQSAGATAAEAAANDPLRSGMALGSGLRAIAGVQRAMGMKKSAAATEKAATGVQVAAMGATVMKKANENPAVKRTLERGQTALKNNPQIAKGLRASLKMAGSVIQTLQQAQQEAQQQQQQQQNGGAGRNASR